MANFAWASYVKWYRMEAPDDVQTERRPHVIPLNKEAADFIQSQYKGKCKDCIYGPLFTGYGWVSDMDGFRLPAFRFVNGDMKLAKLALQMAEEGFAKYQKELRS